MKNYCPYCLSENSLQEQSYQFIAHPMPGHSIPLRLQAQVCLHCEEQVESPSQAVLNSTIISDAKLAWLADHIDLDRAIGYLVKELRRNLGITQAELSKMIGAKGVSISKYELHTVKPSALARTLFKVLAKSKDARNTLISPVIFVPSVSYSIFESSSTLSSELLTFVDHSTIGSIPTATATTAIMHSIVSFFDKSLLAASKIMEICTSQSDQLHPAAASIKTRSPSQKLVPVY